MEPQLDEESVQRTLTTLAERLKHAEGRLSEADFAAVVSITGVVLEESQTLPENSLPVTSLRARALVMRGNALREQGTGVTRKAALACCDEALRLLDRLPPQDDLSFRNLQAKAWMNRGITLLNEGGADYLTESIRCFDRAIEIRHALDGDQEPMIRYSLAAGWMNRADALTRLGGDANLKEAIKSYDEALRVMDRLPIDANPLFCQRTAIAWLNRGLTWEISGTESGYTQALECIDKSISLLENATSVPKQEQLLAAAWLNRGNILLKRQPPDFPAAQNAARRAVQFVSQLERNVVAYADIGLKARYVACRAAAALAERVTDQTARKDIFAEATDVVDDGMELVRHWHALGVRSFGHIPNDLFRFGEKLYQIYQPHFVAEFLEENQGYGLSLEAVSYL